MCAWQLRGHVCGCLCSRRVVLHMTRTENRQHARRDLRACEWHTFKRTDRQYVYSKYIINKYIILLSFVRTYIFSY